MSKKNKNKKVSKNKNKNLKNNVKQNKTVNEKEEVVREYEEILEEIKEERKSFKNSIQVKEKTPLEKKIEDRENRMKIEQVEFEKRTKYWKVANDLLNKQQSEGKDR